MVTKEDLISILKNHKVNIFTQVYYGLSVDLYIDDQKVEYDNKDFGELQSWAYHVFSEKIIQDHEILDTFDCDVNIVNDDVIFSFEFDNTWKFDGRHGEDGVSIHDILPCLPDIINKQIAYSEVELDEDSLYCSFSFNKEFNSIPKLEIHNIWTDDPEEISFELNDDLIEELKMDIVNNIESTFYEYDSLWVNSDDGIDISIQSNYKSVMTYDEVFFDISL